MASTTKILITMEGGVIHDIENIPNGVTVVVRDYDVEGVDTERIILDQYGDECVEDEWGQNGSSTVTNV